MIKPEAGTSFPSLIKALHDPACYDHPVSEIRLIETHISWVLLTGQYVYKIKKPVDLGFLDFTTLEKRRFCCQEELRLNRRLAPQLYLAVVPITGTPNTPRLGTDDEVFEYAVKMIQFPDDARLDLVLEQGRLKPHHIDTLAEELAAFHADIAVAGGDNPFGTPEMVYRPVAENFRQIEPHVATEDMAQLARLQKWSKRAHESLRNDFQSRRHNGFIRECHGDAHLGNMALLEGRVVLFDCLEFNPSLRWIDVMSELAFVTMDLDDRGRPDLGRRCLDRYLQLTGDYAGFKVLVFYQVYRALVRAKVAIIRLGQAGLTAKERQRIRHLYRSYTDLAERFTRSTPTALVITHGLSGAGKTFTTQLLLENMAAIRVRSDVERKRLVGLAAGARTGSGIESCLYTRETSEKTYARLEELARMILRAGFPVIIDAAFLQYAQRDRFRQLAEALGVPFAILDVQASEEILRERVANREREARDASEAGLVVLEHQRKTHEPLTLEESAEVVPVNSEQPPELEALIRRLQNLNKSK